MKFDDVVAVMAEHEIKHADDDTDDAFLVRQLVLSLLSVSAGSQQLMYFAGSKFGKKLEIEADDRDAVIEEVTELFDRWGLGDLKQDDDEAVIEDSVFVDEIETSTDKPVCFFTAGMLAGALRSGCGQKYVVNEVACQGKGDEECRFKMREA